MLQTVNFSNKGRRAQIQTDQKDREEFTNLMISWLTGRQTGQVQVCHHRYEVQNNYDNLARNEWEWTG